MDGYMGLIRSFFFGTVGVWWMGRGRGQGGEGGERGKVEDHGWRVWMGFVGRDGFERREGREGKVRGEGEEMEYFAT